MAGLTVDVAGLNAAAARSTDISDRLVENLETGHGPGGQPSHAGVLQFGAAVTSVRIRQSARMGRHHTAMSTAAIRYADTDDEGADAVTRSV